MGRATGLPRSTVSKLKRGKGKFTRNQLPGIQEGLKALQAREDEALSQEGTVLDGYRATIRQHGSLRAAAGALGLDPANLSKRLRRSETAILGPDLSSSD